MLRRPVSISTTATLVVLFVVLLLFHSASWAEDLFVAKITEVAGEVSLHHGFTVTSPQNGAGLKSKDTLITGPDGSVGIVFSDHTALSLGPDSKFTIREFIFEPDQSRFSFVVKLFRGTAAYVSGLIAKIAPESAKFITPSASIGIRGTKFVIRVEEI